MLKLSWFFVVFFVVFTTNSQTKNVSFNIKWNSNKLICEPCDIDGLSKTVYSIQSQDLHLRGDFEFTYQINTVNYTSISKPKGEYLEAIFTDNINLEVDFGKSRIDNFITLHLNPIIFQNGEYKVVSSIDLIIDYQKIYNLDTRAATFAPESVLKSGSWFKLGVDKAGIYKIDKTMLDAVGVNTSNLNPNHINIYANHVSELPELNSAYHPDDLIKNAIYIEGDADGVFNTSDYILFYAKGVIVESENTGIGFNVSNNNNDSLCYIYLKIDGSDSPKRISVLPNSSLSVTHTVSTFNDVVLHEKDELNLISSGTNWLGEVFDIELSHTIPINLVGLSIGSTVSLESRLAMKLINGTGKFDLKMNGALISSINVNLNNSSYNKGTNYLDNSVITPSVENINLQIDLVRSSPSTVGWLNQLQFNYRRKLSLSSGQVTCRDWNSVGTNNVSKFTLSGANSSSKIWDVTDPTNAKLINASLISGGLTFTQNTDTLRSFAMFNVSQAYTPIVIGTVDNQNLHALPQVDYVIVTHDLFKAQADRLADLHRNKGLSVHVVDIKDVYNEFSCGIADPVSIRWLMKMFYDRANGDPSLMPQSLLLFGDGSYDALNRFDDNTAKLPTYRSKDSESSNSGVSFISSFTSDDFYGMLDDLESMDASDIIDIGIGRFPVNTIEEATSIVNKVEHYMNYGSNLYPNVACNSDGSTTTFGDWRNKAVLIADDENFAKFVDDCEDLSVLIENEHNEVNVLKLYLDAYQQVSTSGGQRYPEVEALLNQYINQGALVFNYVGHGGETGLSLERIVSIPQIEAWTNIHRLPLFVSATCEFSRFDDPNRTSAGEIMLMTPNGGAVAMLTTTRLVYISTNSTLVKNLYSVLFDEVNGEALSMGEIIRQSKNLTAGDNNMRNFTLLGDPALKLGKARPNIVTDSINGVDIFSTIDTLKALSKITISGHIEDYLGAELTNYNGFVFPTVYDKTKMKTTLGQDPESPIRTFSEQNNIIYKGKSTVKNGKFEYTFVVPKDINYAYGKGKLSYYSNTSNSQKLGFDTTIIVGGIDPNGIEDIVGPTIDLYMNDENFANGGLTDSKPLLIAKVSDENGINTSGNGIGHDITVILDGNTASPFILNNFYQADLDTYKSGEVNFQFIDLEPGLHQLVFKIWDVNNNSSEVSLDFEVVEQKELAINHLLNYPNPFTTHTEFYFEHNQIHNIDEARIEIMTVSGKLVKTIFQTVESCAYRSEGIAWDGRDEFGDKLAKGVYVYRLTVKTADGQKSEKLEKLVIL